LLTFEMFGLTPLTQAEMTAAGGDNLGKKEEELSHLVDEIRAEIADHARSRMPASSTDRSWLTLSGDGFRTGTLNVTSLYTPFATAQSGQRSGRTTPLD
jgi:hypothetical protein